LKIFLNNNIIAYLINYCEENYYSDIKISDLAKKLGYNKYYILHLFKEKTGISLHQYIIQLRIKRAKREKQDNTLLDIALKSGFYDQSHFIRYFKRYEGITPKEYYKSTRENYGQHCT
jgi:AraC-like DNA-binding protein